MEEKGLKKVDSPEQLNQYIKLSNPGVWTLLIAIVVLLIGVCIWGYFGRIDTKISSVVIAENNSAYLYVSEENVKKIKVGMVVSLKGDEKKYQIIEINETPVKVTENMDEYARHLGNFQIGEWVYRCRINRYLKDGSYSADVILESIAPMSFVTN